MPGFWLSSIAWTLPAAKLVLIAALVLRHHQPFVVHDLLALLPEAGASCVLLLLARGSTRRGWRLLVGVIAGVLAVATWLAAAAWGFAGVPVGFPLLTRLLLDPTTLRTALTDPALLPQFVGWLGGLLAVWGVVALAVLGLRRALRSLPPRAIDALLVVVALAALGASASRPAPPERRLALVVALGADTQDAGAVALDPDTAAELAAPLRAPRPDAHQGAPDAAPIRNVLILVLESLRREPGTPFTDGFPSAVRFERAYAHHPRSVKTLEALLFGLYPSPGLLSAAWAIDHYDVAPIALPRILDDHGFRSHYFSAMSLGFDNYGGTLTAAGFDEVENVTSGEALTWGVAAPALFDRVAATLEAGAARGERTLVMAWTAECHMPYDFSGERLPDGDPRARYRGCQNALARDVAGLLERLAGEGILQRTLVVVLGDHGQIFASEKAGEVGHGMRVHEQSLRIPLLLLVPGVPGRTDTRLFQPVDVPATILSALGIAIPEPWVGRDMLDGAAPGRRFVVALGTMSDGQAALIDAGGEKVVRPGSGAAPVLYDLDRDPHEEHGTPLEGDAGRAAAARITTYEQLASRAWDERRRSSASEALTFDGHALATRWAAGPCVTTRLTPAGDLRVEPASAGACASGGDPFERRLGRAFDAATLAAGADLRLTIALDARALDPARPPRALVKQWGSDQTITLPLEPHAGGFQSVTASLPPPGANGDTMLAVVGVDPPGSYELRALEIAPYAR